MSGDQWTLANTKLSTVLGAIAVAMALISLGGTWYAMREAVTELKGLRWQMGEVQVRMRGVEADMANVKEWIEREELRRQWRYSDVR